MTDGIRNYIKKHTEKEQTISINPVPWSTFRDSRTVAYHWKGELDFSEILRIQRDCKVAMKLWGYQIYSSKEQLRTLPSDLSFDMDLSQ